MTIRALTIEATAQIGVMLMPDASGLQGPITLEDLTITSQRDPDQVSDPDPTEGWMSSTATARSSPRPRRSLRLLGGGCQHSRSSARRSAPTLPG